MNKKPERCCYPDCFNCPYPDCVWNGVDETETVSDLDLGIKPTYYSLHRAEILEKAKQYRQENREKVRAQGRACYERHKETYKERIVKRNRERYWKDPEKARAQKREYYRRKKERLEACV